MTRGRLIAFEGVDGAGKSTALRTVADALRARGQAVFTPRVGKEHASRPTRQIRRLTRDRRNLDLAALPELLLYCAREAQVAAELVEPALARGETVLLDRSFLTPVVLGRARGLDASTCQSIARLAAQQREPDLTLVFDVHPRTSRLRKRLEKIRNGTLGDGGRKGLAGSAFKERIRDGYRQLAAECGHPLLCAERATREQLAERVLAVIDGATPARAGQTDLDASPRWWRAESWAWADALAEQPGPEAIFFAAGLRGARSLRANWLEREPELVAWALDEEDPLRAAAALRAPRYALAALCNRPLEDGDLRLSWVDREPESALRGLAGVGGSQMDALRERLVGAAPGGVVASLAGRDDDVAHGLRQRCWERAEPALQSASLRGCASERCWELRRDLLRRSPVHGVESLRGVCDSRAQAVLEAHAERAPKIVLSALLGRGDADSHALREALWESGREAVNSLRGLDDSRAWQLRERARCAHPSSVVHSLLGLPPEREDVVRLVEACTARAPGDLWLLRRVQRLDEWHALPGWVSTVAV